MSTEIPKAKSVTPATSVGRIILRRQLRPIPILVVTGVILGILTVAAIHLLHGQEHEIVDKNGNIEITGDGSPISIGGNESGPETLHNHLSYLKNVPFALIVTATLFCVLLVGAAVCGAVSACRTRAYLSAGVQRRSIFGAHIKAFGIGVAFSAAFIATGIAIHGIVSGDFSGRFKLIEEHIGMKIETPLNNLWLLVLAATIAIASAYVTTYAVAMLFVRFPWYLAGGAILVTSLLWSGISWALKTATNQHFTVNGPRYEGILDQRHISAYQLIIELIFIIFFTSIAWLCMRRIQARR